MRYALKCIDKDDNALRELAILKKLDHPFIVKLHSQTIYRPFAQQGSFASKIGLLLELVSGCELIDALEHVGVAQAACFYAGCLVLALGYLADRGICHLDIKAENCRLDAEGYLKLLDFGSAVDAHCKQSGLVVWRLTLTNQMCCVVLCCVAQGTPRCMAPEIINGCVHSTMCDLWSLGVVVYWIVIGDFPFGKDSSATNEQIYQEVLDADVHFPERLPPCAVGLLQGLLTKDPLTRLGHADLQHHDFFKACCWPKLLNKQYVAPWKPPPEAASLTWPSRPKEATPAKCPGSLDARQQLCEDLVRCIRNSDRAEAEALLRRVPEAERLDLAKAQRRPVFVFFVSPASPRKPQPPILVSCQRVHLESMVSWTRLREALLRPLRARVPVRASDKTDKKLHFVLQDGGLSARLASATVNGAMWHTFSADEVESPTATSLAKVHAFAQAITGLRSPCATSRDGVNHSAIHEKGGWPRLPPRGMMAVVMEVYLDSQAMWAWTLLVVCVEVTRLFAQPLGGGALHQSGAPTAPFSPQSAGASNAVGVAPAEECECETLATSASSSAQCIGASNAAGVASAEHFETLATGMGASNSAPSPAMLRAWCCLELGCVVKVGVASAEHVEPLATGMGASNAASASSSFSAAPHAGIFAYAFGWFDWQEQGHAQAVRHPKGKTVTPAAQTRLFVGVVPAEECETCYDALLGLGCAVKAGVASAEHFETFAAGPAQGMGASNSVGVAPAEECECETLATTASSSAQCIGASNAAGVASAEHFETFAVGVAPAEECETLATGALGSDAAENQDAPFDTVHALISDLLEGEGMTRSPATPPRGTSECMSALLPAPLPSPRGITNRRQA
eukprot:s3639_g1.t7